MNQQLQAYIESEIIPRYAGFDEAHRVDHARTVIEQSLALADLLNGATPERSDKQASACRAAKKVPLSGGAGGSLNHVAVNRDMVFTTAAYHDTGLCEGRERHHLVSGRIIREDQTLRTWFTPEQIETMAQAAEDHRASSDHEPRSIYGRIVAEADRIIDGETIVRRTIQFGLSHYPELDRDGHWDRMCAHLKEKYDYGGYLKLWIPESPNAARLEEFRQNLRKPGWLRERFDRYYCAER